MDQHRKILKWKISSSGSAYVKLLRNLIYLKRDLKKDNIVTSFKVVNSILRKAVANPLYELLNISLSTDFDKDEVFNKIKEKILQEGDNDKHIRIDIFPFFRKNNTLNPIKVKAEFKKILPFFPKEEHNLILNNFDQYDAVNIISLLEDK